MAGRKKKIKRGSILALIERVERSRDKPVVTKPTEAQYDRLARLRELAKRTNAKRRVLADALDQVSPSAPEYRAAKAAYDAAERTAYKAHRLMVRAKDAVDNFGMPTRIGTPSSLKARYQAAAERYLRRPLKQRPRTRSGKRRTLAD